jgi:hypothetical protein
MPIHTSVQTASPRSTTPDLCMIYTRLVYSTTSDLAYTRLVCSTTSDLTCVFAYTSIPRQTGTRAQGQRDLPSSASVKKREKVQHKLNKSLEQGLNLSGS